VGPRRPADPSGDALRGLGSVYAYVCVYAEARHRALLDVLAGARGQLQLAKIDATELRQQVEVAKAGTAAATAATAASCESSRLKQAQAEISELRLQLAQSVKDHKDARDAEVKRLRAECAEGEVERAQLEKELGAGAGALEGARAAAAAVSEAAEAAQATAQAAAARSDTEAKALRSELAQARGAATAAAAEEEGRRSSECERLRAQVQELRTAVTGCAPTCRAERVLAARRPRYLPAHHVGAAGVLIHPMCCRRYWVVPMPACVARLRDEAQLERSSAASDAEEMAERVTRLEGALAKKDQKLAKLEKEWKKMVTAAREGRAGPRSISCSPFFTPALPSMRFRPGAPHSDPCWPSIAHRIIARMMMMMMMMMMTMMMMMMMMH
jgi:hypothetical protein